MPDSGQKTLPLMHKLKALAGIVEPRRDTASEIYVHGDTTQYYTYMYVLIVTFIHVKTYLRVGRLSI